MNWRSIQLGNNLCDQDRLVLNLVNQQGVRLYGNDLGFSQHLNIDATSDFCVILFNEPLWLSSIKSKLYSWLSSDIKKCYIGVNRYQILGNDTHGTYCDFFNNTHSEQIIKVITKYLSAKQFFVKNSGFFEKDQGRYFNFVQPLTWLYAEYAIN